MKNVKTILIAFLLGVAGFCVYKYIISIDENKSLSANILRLNDDVKALEDEKNSLETDLEREKELNNVLNQENTGLKGNLTLSQEKLAQLETDFQSSRKVIDELNGQFSLVKTENTALRDQIQELELNINQAKVDKEQLQARLSSISELKKAIKELRQAARQVKKQTRKRIEEKEKIILGNSGFLIKDGKPTLSGKIKIEVEPLPSDLK